MNAHNDEVLLLFEPLDTLFFRDGSPWDQGESDQSDVASQFPPPPSTMVGAVRAAYARALGWSGRSDSDWPDAIKSKLGDGDGLGELRFRGPVLLRDDELLFPAPANLMVSADGHSTALLRPGEPLRCDLGDAARLPAMPDHLDGAGWKPASTQWLTGAGMCQWLRGEVPVPASLIESTALWQHEARIGIQRNTKTRTTEEGAMYSPRHIRLGANVSLGLWASGLPDVHDEVAAQPQPLGGESRTAWVSTPAHALDLLPAPENFASGAQGLCYTVAILSPLPLECAPLVGDTDRAGLPGRLVSACIPRPQMLGGWDSVHRRPLSLAPHLAPGSVLFMRAQAKDADAIRALHRTCIGSRAAWGHGFVAIGTWSDEL